VFDPDGVPEVHDVVITWADGARTFLQLPPGAFELSFFLPQFHKKGHRKHPLAFVQVIDQQVLELGGGIDIPGFLVRF
jgi:hypothetical protein